MCGFIVTSCGGNAINALAAADTTLIPVQAQYLSAKGLEQLLQTMEAYRPAARMAPAHPASTTRFLRKL